MWVGNREVVSLLCPQGEGQPQQKSPGRKRGQEKPNDREHDFGLKSLLGKVEVLIIPSSPGVFQKSLGQRGAASTAQRLREWPRSPQRCCGFFSCQGFLRGEESKLKKSPMGLKVGERVELHPWGLTSLLGSAGGGVEGGGAAADGVAGCAGAGQAAVGGVVGEQQEAAVVGAEW